MKLVIAAFFFFLFSFTAYSQYWGTTTTSNFTNEAIDVETDNSGNLYVTGYISGETSFDINTVQLSAAGNGDVYIAKYSATGILIWIKQFGGNYSDRPTDLAIGDDNSIYVTGQYFGQIIFGGFTLNSVNNSKDIFLLKLDAAGNVIWANSEGGSGSENAYGITADNQNNVILTGQFEGNTTIAGQAMTSMIDPITNLPSYDLFVSKYAPNGNPLWVRAGLAEYEDRGLAVSCDSQNNIFITGQFSDTLIFAGTTINNTAYNVGFLCKFSSSGQLLWLNQLKAGMVMAYDLEINVFDEAVVIGDFIGNFIYQSPGGTQNITNPYSRKIFAMKTDNDGNYVWGASLGSNNDVSARSISVDAAKNSYITGYFKCDWSELHNNNTATFNSVGFKDPYLLKIDNQGTIVYTKQFGGKGNDEGHGVAILPNSQPVICGSHTNNLMFPYAQGSNYTVSNTNNFNLNYINAEPYVPYNSISYPYLIGDLSRNSFLLNAIHANTPAYNFFVNEPIDSLYGEIEFGIDTLHFCDSVRIYYEPLTYPGFGPDYNYLWNSGQTTQFLDVLQTNDYSVLVERADGCSVGEDSIFCIHHNLPPLPLLSDNLGIAINAPGEFYQYYNFCAPDSVEIWFSNLCPNCDISIIQNNSVIFNDSLPHYYSNEWVYNVEISDSFCTDNGYFEIDLDYVLPFDTIQPYMFFLDDTDLNDTITTCYGNVLHVNIYDFLTNPSATLNQFNLQPLVDSAMFINPLVDDEWWQYLHGYAYRFIPLSSGWHTFNYTATIGYDNLCGIDTLMYDIYDSVYIIINQLPYTPVTIYGDNLLCPDGSAYLVLSNTVPGLNWYGPGIAWQNSIGDSIQITIAGDYFYAGTLIDSISGCSDTLAFEHTINLKQPPPILMNPSDGIVCPNDSVTMYVDDIYLSYDWIGPDGFSLSSTFFHTDDDQGFYYCHVEDTTGCILTTAPAEIREFTTPTILVEPSYFLCPGESTTLTVTYLGNALIQWTSPIISNANELTVNQIGTYICEIQQCGMTFIDSVEILDGSFQINLTASDTLLCYNENAVLTSTPGLNDYQWSDGATGMNTNIVVDGGLYSVSAMNQYGCLAHSDTVQIYIVDGSFPPDIADVTICPGENVTLSESFGNALNWYDIDTTFLSAGAGITINSILNDTAFLAAYAIVECPLAYTNISISVVDSLPLNQILGDTIICPNASTTLSLLSAVSSIEWYVDGVFVSTDTTLLYNAPQLGPASQIIMAIVNNSCFTDTIIQNVYTHQPGEISLSSDSLIICSYSIIPLSVNGIYDSLIWTSISGSVTLVDTFYLTSQEGNGTIYVQAFDLNGCLTNMDSVVVISSSFYFDIYQSFGYFCNNDSILIGVNSTTDSLIWTTPYGSSDTSEINFVLNDSTEGWYSIQLWDSLGCMYSDSLYVNSNDIPIFSLNNDTILCLNDWMEFSSWNDTLTFSWEGYGVVDSVPALSNEWYIVTATSSYGCTFTDSIYVTAINCEDELPNVITANGDGVNDYFVINDALVFTNNELIIYNRWGNIVYSMERYDNTFGGLELSDGVYFYNFMYDRQDPESRFIQGYLHIVR